jgi:quercetin dioxygenase-like cupin family protein
MHLVDRDALPRLSVQEDGGYRQVSTGVHLQIQFGFTKKGHVPPSWHSHPAEQVSIILEGSYELGVGEEILHVKAGDVILIPPGVSHGGVRFPEDSITIDIFSPPRPELNS